MPISHVQLVAGTISPVEHPTMGHIVLDLTSLAYQPKSRERSARPTKGVTFALSQRKSAYPARVQKLDDEEDDKPLVRPDGTTVSEEEDEDDKPLVQPATKEKAPKRESSAICREFLHRYEEEKGSKYRRGVNSGSGSVGERETSSNAVSPASLLHPRGSVSDPLYHLFTIATRTENPCT